MCKGPESYVDFVNTGFRRSDNFIVIYHSYTLDFISIATLPGTYKFFSKRKQLGRSLTKMYWLFGRKSKLSINNKLLIYKVILKSIWTYGIQLWGTTSNSNIEILERSLCKVLRLIVDAPWYVSNSVIRNDL
jgi:hypothetical protein